MIVGINLENKVSYKIYDEFGAIGEGRVFLYDALELLINNKESGVIFIEDKAEGEWKITGTNRFTIPCIEIVNLLIKLITSASAEGKQKLLILRDQVIWCSVV